MTMKREGRKVFGVVTNMGWAGEKLIPWFCERCGKSEQGTTT